MSSIEFRPVTQDNFHKIIKLRVAPDQDDYVDSNLYSIAYSKVCPTLESFGIYNDDNVVGFVQYGKDPKKPRYMLAEIMIAIEFQSKGFGQLALDKVIDQLKQNKQFNSLVLTLVPGNDVAKNIYLKYGFYFIDEIIFEDELSMQLDF